MHAARLDRVPEHGNQVVRGVVALEARLVDGRLVAFAEVELLRDGEIPF